MTRLIGFVIFVIFLLLGAVWAHYYAQHSYNWVHLSSVKASNGAAVSKIEYVSDPLTKSRQLLTEADELWRDGDSDNAINTLESAIDSVDGLKENADLKGYFNNEESRNDYKDWRELLRLKLREWKKLSASRKADTSDGPMVAATAPSTLERTESLTFPTSSSVTSTVVGSAEEVDEYEVLDEVVPKLTEIGVNPPPSLGSYEEGDVIEQERAVEEHTIPVEVEPEVKESLEFTPSAVDKTEMWLNGFNALKSGDDSLAVDRKQAVEYYKQSKGWYDQLHELFPEYQKKSVLANREELARKISSLR